MNNWSKFTKNGPVIFFPYNDLASDDSYTFFFKTSNSFWKSLFNSCKFIFLKLANSFSSSTGQGIITHSLFLKYLPKLLFIILISSLFFPLNLSSFKHSSKYASLILFIFLYFSESKSLKVQINLGHNSDIISSLSIFF